MERGEGRGSLVGWRQTSPPGAFGHDEKENGI